MASGRARTFRLERLVSRQCSAEQRNPMIGRVSFVESWTRETGPDEILALVCLLKVFAPLSASSAAEPAESLPPLFYVIGVSSQVTSIDAMGLSPGPAGDANRKSTLLHPIACMGGECRRIVDPPVAYDNDWFAKLLARSRRRRNSSQTRWFPSMGTTTTSLPTSRKRSSTPTGDGVRKQGICPVRRRLPASPARGGHCQSRQRNADDGRARQLRPAVAISRVVGLHQ